MLNKNIYANLLVQFEKVFKHNRQEGLLHTNNLISFNYTPRT
jgi:hypothetical protein